MFLKGFYKRANVKMLGRIYSAFRRHPAKLSLYNSLISQSKHYSQTIDRLERTAKNVYQLGRGSPEMVEAADHARRLAHNAFISNLTAVTRNAAQSGINIQEMAPVIHDRNRATDFALEVAKRFRTVK